MHVSITPDIIFHIGEFPVTNTLLTAWIVIAIIVIVALAIYFNIKKIPGKLQNVAEIVIDGLLDFFTTIAGSREKARQFFPLVASIFILVLASNWFGILPGVGTIGLKHAEEEVYVEESAPIVLEESHEEESGAAVSEVKEEKHETLVPILRSVNSDLNMTLALALLVMTTVHVVGITTLGVFKHAHKFLDFSGPIKFFVGILELIGEFAKIVSFSFRLFGNIFAGEVLLVIVSSLVPYLIPVPFFGLELFVGVIQALIFSVLSMMFLSAATVAHEDHGEGHAKAHH